MIIRRLLYYLNPLTLLRKRESDAPNINLSMMHAMNRISVFVFIICMLLLLMKFL
ncbi:MAG: hypothetical protein KDC37_05560 [Flavobacteriales bacterium]|nr:hypothetical protein [Flavobacteriales bacterium]